MKKKILLFLLSAVLVFLCACGNDTTATPSDGGTTDVSAPIVTEPSKLKAMVYYSSLDSMYLIPEEREIEYEKEEEIPTLLIDLLIKGPVTENLYPAINASTEIKDIKVENKTAKVTVGDNFIGLNSGGSTKEFMALYSITNTLCELDNIDEVVFINSDGTPMEEFGSYLLDLPLIKDTTLAD